MDALDTVVHLDLEALPPFGDNSVVIDRTVCVGRVEVAEHPERGGNLRHFRVPLRMLLQRFDELLDVRRKHAREGLITPALTEHPPLEHVDSFFASAGRQLIRVGGCVAGWTISMADAPYLVALALLDIRGKRALPLAGRSLSAAAAAAAEAADPGEDGKGLALELLLRLWQRSDEGPIQRVAGDNSLLVVTMPLEVMTEQLPPLKASWIASGETEAFMAKLQTLTLRGWRMVFAKYEPISYQPWP